MEYVQRDSPSAFAAARMEGGGGAAVDDLFVDDLMDFSNGYSETEEQQLEMWAAETSQGLKEEAPLPPPDDGSFSGMLEFQPLEAEEGLESLEWLSHFVEDSFSDYSFVGEFPAAENKPETAATERLQPWFATAIQTKARTKRNRAGVRVRPVLSPSFVDSPTSSTSSTLSTTSFPSLPSQADDSSVQVKKKPKRKPADGGAAQPRRCSHCGVTKTPQWRAGPQGSKTLCNACGVRFKTGRLLPEYRPASSPTFSSEMHSNHHRKVLEMRRKKEVQADAGLDPSKTGMMVAGLS